MLKHLFPRPTLADDVDAEVLSIRRAQGLSRLGLSPHLLRDISGDTRLPGAPRRPDRR